MSLLDGWVGRRFRHQSEGYEATLVKTDRGFGMERELRGEKLVEAIAYQALMSNWTDQLHPSARLLDEEIQKVADVADRVLRACVLHEPYLLHEMPIRGHEVFDAEFHGQIKDFLRGKYND